MEKRSPKYWPDELKPLMVRRVLTEVFAKRTGASVTDGCISLGVRDTVAFEVQCAPMKPILHGKKFNTRIKKARDTFVDLRWSHWENESVDNKPREAKWWFRPTRMHYRDNPLPEDDEHDPLFLRPVPVRHWGIHNRMYTQSGLIKGVSCV